MTEETKNVEETPEETVDMDEQSKSQETLEDAEVDDADDEDDIIGDDDDDTE
jgi:hypothetical protein